MKFRKWGQSLLATALSAGIGLGLTSCGTSNTVDFVYLLSAKNSPGQINVYKADSITGALTQLTTSPFAAGNDPIALVAAPNGQTLYVINHGDNTIEEFSIGGDATPTKKNTYTAQGSSPLAVAVNPAGTLLFVLSTYAPGYSATAPGPGALAVYPINSDGSLGTPASQTVNGQSASFYQLGAAPSALTVLPNGSTVYVTDQLTANVPGCNAGQGGVVALTVTSSGVLTPVGTSPYCAGVTPSAIAVHPIGNYLYVTDSSQNQIVGYHVQSDGSLLTFVGGPVATGTFPDSIVVDPRGLYIYVANKFGGSSAGIESYSIAADTGIPSSTGSYGTGAFPQCVIVEPALARFVYSADFEGDGVTGYKLDPNTGMLTGTENAPYFGTGLSTCIAAISHGNHPIIHVQGTAS